MKNPDQGFNVRSEIKLIGQFRCPRSGGGFMRSVTRTRTNLDLSVG